DVSVEYVWSHTKSNYPFIYKLSGTIAGMAGSLLFWIWMIIIPWFYEEMKAIKKPVDDKLMDWTRIALLSVLGVMLFILCLHNIFDLTPEFSANPMVRTLATDPDGLGLNSLLQTELMVIHPPVIFMAYGFLTIPFASALANLITGNKKWVGLSINWSRAGWLFLTLGIGLGALWAYVVLGWGGYWAWDPVETSSLLPWILLTGFLHVQLMYKRKGDYEIMAPVLGIMTLLLVFFATFTTRAGGLWVSVHDFGEADLSVSPMTRLMEILSSNNNVLIYFLLMIAIIAITLILVFFRYRKMNKDKEVKTYALSELINDDILMLATVFLSILITVLTLAILIMGINGLSPENFDMPIGILAIISILVLMVCLTWRHVGRKWIVIITIGTLCLSIIGFLMFPDMREAAATAPILALALAGTSYKIIKSFNPKHAWRSMKLVSAHLVHLSIILIMIGYIGSNFMVTEQSVSLTVGGGGETVGAYTIYAEDIEVTADSIFIDIEVWKGDTFIKRISPGIQLIDGQLRNEIKVAGALTNDIYLTYNYDQASLGQNIVDFEVKILPLMKCLWGGMWLMSIAIVIRVAVEKTTKSKASPEKKEGQEEVKDEKYYESLLGKELESMDSSSKSEEEEVKDDKYFESRLDSELESVEEDSEEVPKETED
ncbi:MAG: cytochrome c biogenesis protein CcsA, partial [Thermoplasmata archaeon]|nr:cytochrome c biogenesis protein CcsA [Thermoplasmata archaeon]